MSELALAPPTDTVTRMLCTHTVVDAWDAELVCNAFATWIVRAGITGAAFDVQVYRCTAHTRPLVDAGGWTATPLPIGPPPGRHRA